MKKIIFFIFALIILLVININILDEIHTPFGIKLPIGWGGGCYSSSRYGFPFSTLSCPGLGTYCACTSNFIGSILNFVCLVILFYVLYIIFKKKEVIKSVHNHRELIK